MSKSGTILLTGGTGLIGQVLARELIEAGYGLILTGRDKCRLELVMDGLRRDSDVAQVTPLVMDLSSPGSVNRLEEFLDETSLSPPGRRDAHATHILRQSSSLGPALAQLRARTSC